MASKLYRGFPRLFVAAAILTGSLWPTALILHAEDTSVGDALAAKYFRLETEKLSRTVIDEINSHDEWEERKPELRRQLHDMLGLDPLPERGDLEATVTGSFEEHGIVVENLHFQSLPGLYVTANFYRPANVEKPLPTILYVCGHARAVKDGVSLGNKTAYQHHGAWFARNGYTCLTIDTIQLGEIEGTHHGTYRYGKWWWNDRGYTPLGVEAWNSIRALDYLETRPEVDATKFGVTGRSGGGIYSWVTAALDDRIAAAVPVAGITTLHNYVVDGCVEGHCDCMFIVNTYRWDYPLLAALVAPRPLLISNTDRDRIFPLDGVVNLHGKVRKIYQLHNAAADLGLQITAGPHKDTQELHLHAFRWFNHHLRDTDELIDTPAEKLFEPERLKVFETLPEVERVTTVHEWFVPAVDEESPGESEELARSIAGVKKQLDELVFRGWPSGDEVEPPEVRQADQWTQDGLKIVKYEFTSQTPYRLPIYLVSTAEGSSETASEVEFHIADQAQWDAFADVLNGAAKERNGSSADTATAQNAGQGRNDASKDADTERQHRLSKEDAWQRITRRARENPQVVSVIFPPRGIGPTCWTDEERAQTHIRRRFMLLGQTDDGMRIWDVRRALQALDQIPLTADATKSLIACGRLSPSAFYASLYEDRIAAIEVTDPPPRNRDGINLLNISRVLEIPQLVAAAAGRTERVTIRCSDPAAWQELADASPNIHIESVEER